MFKLSDFDYDLPQELIAQYPASRRELSRLLVLDRSHKTIQHQRFCDIINTLQKGDLLVLNNTKVLPARLIGRRGTGGRVEILLLKRESEPSGRKKGERYQALIKPLGRLRVGEEIFLDSGFSCWLADAKKKIIEFNGTSAKEIMQKVGIIPLPPYIRRSPDFSDRRRYQTVFAKREGAVAAPTAGLHFSKRLLGDIRKRGVRIVYLTLHVNHATFLPVRTEDIRDHQMFEEYLEIPRKTVELIRKTRKGDGRIFAVGTTVCKALEDSEQQLLERKSPAVKISKPSKLFIYPPYSFKVVDALITNFHLPRTSLLMLVAAFAGRDLILDAYRAAVENKYRFYSYGDAMLIK